MTYLCIPLRGKYAGVARVSESALALVEGYYWYGTKSGYAFSPRVGLMHRRLMAAEIGEQVDHKNFDGFDNRDGNIQCCPPAINQIRTRKRRNTPWPYKGVRMLHSRWYARIKGRHIGSFATPEDAARAYDAEARKIFGHHAVCNFGEGQ